MTDQLFPVYEAFIKALYEAKSRVSTYEDYFEDQAPNRAYNQLFRAIEKATPADVAWRGGLWEFVCSFADTIWENDIPEGIAVRDFSNTLQNILENLASTDWIACVPLERAFQRFPEFTDFGPFSIVNARARNPESDSTLFESFQDILTTYLGITFMDSSEVRESYLQLAAHFYQKSSSYIPGRPQLVIGTGRGERQGNQQLLQDKLRQFVPLIRVCQIDLKLREGMFEAVGGPRCRMPDGITQIPGGLIEVPCVAVAIKKQTGQADWWMSRLFAFETNRGDGYDSEQFVASWRDIAMPVLNARNAGLSGRMRDAIDSALQLMATCRYSEMGNLMLNSVIATETILNPFNMTGEITERFALMIAALTGESPENRREVYRTAKRLYHCRCHAVHRSQLQPEKEIMEVQKMGQEAFSLFLKCLKVIVQWASARLEQGSPCNQEAFSELYVESIFPI